ncbi:hypothetical protein CAPTEDRAFT_198493 [Capitella teleta]|uniref:Nucleotide-diphospho-sugar transferase domain-containing protein n=1 Tax=Capitella teleta TaxID=283909 RepID=R7UFE7_CAPTE|nr:hypothetical protein CAPTEDRAFT_198493 [Capitella teleta]|eukprot:ELU04833.1 hypothetical protein CAPTEDRAFT_198493 [Capitella teleta]
MARLIRVCLCVISFWLVHIVIDLVKPRNLCEKFIQYESLLDTCQLQYGYNGTIGRQFRPPFDFMTSLNLHRMKLANESYNAKDTDFTFVMAASRNHFEQSMDAVASIQENFPDNRIVYFDWNLSKLQREQMTKWCNVELRDFDMKLLPTYHEYAHKIPRYQSMKIQAVALVLVETPYVIWADASVRFLKSDLRPQIALAKQNGDLVFFTRTEIHSTFAVTDPNTYEFLPTDLSQQQRPIHVQSTSFMLINTPEVFHNVIWWWLICSLDKSCIAPNENTHCFPNTAINNMTEYLGCHRCDQSVVNVLVSNWFNFNQSRYFLSEVERPLIKIERFKSMKLAVKQCEDQEFASHPPDSYIGTR